MVRVDYIGVGGVGSNDWQRLVRTAERRFRGRGVLAFRIDLPYLSKRSAAQAILPSSCEGPPGGILNARHATVEPSPVYFEACDTWRLPSLP